MSDTEAREGVRLIAVVELDLTCDCDTIIEPKQGAGAAEGARGGGGGGGREGSPYSINANKSVTADGSSPCACCWAVRSMVDSGTGDAAYKLPNDPVSESFVSLARDSGSRGAATAAAT